MIQPPYRLETAEDRMRCAGEVRANRAAIDCWTPDIEGAAQQTLYLSNLCAAKLALIAAYDANHAP